MSRVAATARLAALAVLLSACAASPAPAPPAPPDVATFSIVAFDAETGQLGVAVQSKVVSVGAIVPWARAGVGAIATQAYANPLYGPSGLQALAAGASAEACVAALVERDEASPRRQLAVVDAKGRAAAFTGASCHPWAGHRSSDKGYAVQGNLLAGEAVVTAMAEAFEAAEGEFGARLIAALEAGQAAGGDRRGRQSAALLIVREGWGYGGLGDRYRDVRVDDHPTPIKELRRVYELHKALFPQPK